jgi:hypothetical protein
VMTNMSVKEPTIAAKVSPSRNFMTRPVPPPGEHAVCSETTSCQKAHREESRKIGPCLRFGRTHLRAARLPQRSAISLHRKRPFQNLGG